MELRADDALIPVECVPRVVLPSRRLARLHEQHVPLLQIRIDLRQSPERRDRIGWLAGGDRGVRVRDGRTPKRAAELVLLDVEPVVEVGRSGDLQARAEVTAVERERLECVGCCRVADDLPRSRSKRRDIGGDPQRDGAAIGDQRVGQAGPEVAQVPAKAAAWIRRFVKQELGEHLTLHRPVAERDSREQRERLRPQLE
jgi:hypothetical protein